MKKQYCNAKRRPSQQEKRPSKSKMPPISNSNSPFLQVLNLLNLDEVIDLSNIQTPMKFLLARNDKIAIGESKIFYLDPFTLRNYEDTERYCKSLDMTVALPRNEADNDLIAKLMRKWNNTVQSPKFEWIEAWLGLGLTKYNRRKGLRSTITN